MAGWIWPVVAVVVGLALGIMLGAVRQRGRRAGPAAGGEAEQAVAGAAGPEAGAGRDTTPQQRLLERLRAANLQLSAQLKSLAESNSRQSQEREQERQGERLRHEREIEELKQAHSNELSHLMDTLVEQVDGLNKQHAEQLKNVELELERARQEGRRTTTSSPGTLGGGAKPSGTAQAGATRSAAGPSDYSATLPMESYKER
ncbi:MAG TPA: hypothetical protein VGQ91_00375 [Ideonella sp.]|nr:hypothetical protein [Ideonella sp.]